MDDGNRWRPRAASPARVRELIGEPAPLIYRKIQDRLDEYSQFFIASSPYCCIASMNARGQADSTPRGDDPGFVRVLDDRTLAIPDREGNQIADTFGNIAENPGVGMLFLVPGYQETLRVNGRAYASDEPELLAMMTARGKTPRVATVVEVEEVYLHCGRSIVRAGLWDIVSQRLADDMPSGGTIVAAHLGSPDISASDLDASLEDGYRNNL